MFRLILGLSLALMFGLGALVQPAAAQVTNYAATVLVVNCSGPIPPDVSPFEDNDLPCEAAVGVTFTFTNGDTGEEYGTCESQIVDPANDYGTCTVIADIGVPIVITENTSAIPAGYQPFQNPITIELSENPPDIPAYFINQAPIPPDAPKYDLPIHVINCPDLPDDLSWEERIGQCEPGIGIEFTASHLGEVEGTCVAEADGAIATCHVPVNFGTFEVYVSENGNTVPDGYYAIEEFVVLDIPAESTPAGEGPVATFVNELIEAPPAQQGTVDLLVNAINCPDLPEPDEFPFDNWEHECEPAPGVGFFAQVEGVDIGSCVTAVNTAPEPQSVAYCTIPVNFGTTVVVVEDVSTVPEGYIAVDPPVVTVEVPDGPGGDQPLARFINVQGTPIGGEPTPPSDTGAPTPQLPNTGTGPTLKQLVSFFR
jgi:hypothetical protein